MFVSIDILREALKHGTSFQVSSLDAAHVGGGSINQCFALRINHNERYFLKVNDKAKFPNLFSQEAEGLITLQQLSGFKVPAVIQQFDFGQYQFLLLEWIEQGKRDRNFWEEFGRRLGNMHKITSPYFGWPHNNYMGALPQLNTPTPAWIDFFIQYRFEPQWKLAVDKGMMGPEHLHSLDKLCLKLPQIFPEEVSSLVHGDLWSGNFLSNENNQPVLIDPAVSYGHRIVDIAMTKLFGGFAPEFYAAYHEIYPFPANLDEQIDICQLYPLLIHLNLFGKSYLHDILLVLRRY